MCEKRRNDIELNVKTDETHGGGRYGDRFLIAQVRNIREPIHLTANEYKEHMTTHGPCRS